MSDDDWQKEVERIERRQAALDRVWGFLVAMTIIALALGLMVWEFYRELVIWRVVEP